MQISVVICTTGREELDDCLNSIQSQTFEDFETIVISNASLSDRLDDVRYFKTDNKNLSEQRNLGLEKSKGEVVAFIDDDAIASEEWLENLFRHYREEDVMCVGGKAIPNFKCEVPEKLRKLDKHILYGLIGGTFIEWDEAGEIKSPLIWACNMSFRKSVFDEVGYFPSELGRRKDKLLSEEETYMQLKILENDYKIVYDPDAVVEHQIDPERLKEEYLLKRSFWQGVSEAKRLEVSDGLEPFLKYKEEIENLALYKFLEGGFELATDHIEEFRKDKGADFSDLQCYCPWYNMSIFADGRVSPCFFFEEGDSLKERSLSEVWEGDFFEKAREKFRKNKLPETCKNCNSWNEEKMNKIREKLRDGDE